MAPFKWLNCDNRCEMFETIYRRMTFSQHLYDRLHARIHAARGSSLCIDVTVCGTPYCDMCFFWSELSYIPAMIKYLSYKFCNIMNFSLRLLHFFGSVYRVLVIRPLVIQHSVLSNTFHGRQHFYFTVQYFW